MTAEAPPLPSSQVRAAIYLRISSDRTGEGEAVARQRVDCENLVKRRGWTATATFEDNGVSAAGKSHRPEFTALIAAIRRGEVDTVVAWALDRLARTARDRLALVEACQDYGTVIALVQGSDMDTSNASGRLLIGLLGEVAQMEIGLKSERQKRANTQRAQAGNW